jgi:hypothetical protein
VDYTLADLARVTGAKRRSLQLWADAKIIAANRGTDRAGTGTHRRFSRKEAIIACIIHAFALHQIAIGELQHIARVVRFFIQIGEGRRERDPDDTVWVDIVYPTGGRKDASFRKILESAIKGEGDGTLVYESWRDEKYDEGVVNIFHTKKVEFQNLDKPHGFAAAILLRNYLSKIDT